MDINIFQSWSICFHSGLRPSFADRLLALPWQKSFWKRGSLPGELLSDFTVIETIHSTGQVLWQVCWLTSSTALPLCLPLSIPWFNWTPKSIIKTQLAKFVEALHTPWSKALLSVLLNLGSSPFETYTLFIFWDSPRISNALGSHLFWPTTDKKRDILILQGINCCY